MWVWIAICALALVVLLYAEAQGKTMVNAVAKPIASASFVAAALTAGATHSVAGQALLIALVWSFVGDVLLIPRSRTAFVFGMAAFAMAHLGYTFGFKLRGLDWTWVLIGGALMAAAGAAFFVKLRPAIAKKAPALLAPVGGYIVVITLMMAFAIGSVAEVWDPLPLAAAVAFWLSDITVAMVRFADGARTWRIVGLPLYYAAQFMFVATLG